MSITGNCKQILTRGESVSASEIEDWLLSEKIKFSKADAFFRKLLFFPNELTIFKFVRFIWDSLKRIDFITKIIERCFFIWFIWDGKKEIHFFGGIQKNIRFFFVFEKASIIESWFYSFVIFFLYNFHSLLTENMWMTFSRLTRVPKEIESRRRRAIQLI